MKIFNATVLFFISFIGLSQNVKLSGKITNPTGKWVYLREFTENKGRYVQTDLDSTELASDGTFQLIAKIKDKCTASFYDGTESMDVLLLPNYDLFLTLNTTFFDETARFSGKGANENNAVRELYLIRESMEALQETRLDLESPDTTAIFKELDSFSNQFKILVSDFIKEMPDFKEYGEAQINEVDAYINYKKKNVAKELRFKNTLKALNGAPAIDFEGIDLTGKKVRLADYKGKITVVDFWATWCGPCRAEFPALKELEAKYGERINFVSVGVYCKEDDWRKMAQEQGFSHNIFISKEAEQQIKAYDVQFIPRYLVLDENFTIIDPHAPRPSSGELEKFFVK